MEKSQGKHSHSLGFGLKSKSIKLNWIFWCSYWIKRFGFLCYFLFIFNVAETSQPPAFELVFHFLNGWTKSTVDVISFLITFWTLTPPYVPHGIERCFFNKYYLLNRELDRLTSDPAMKTKGGRNESDLVETLERWVKSTTVGSKHRNRTAF